MGGRVKIGDRDFDVKPLTLGGLRRMVKGGAHKHLGNMPASMEDWTEVHIDAIACFAHALLVRSEPGLSVEAVEDMIELSQLPTVVPQLVAAAGLVGGASQGEASGSKS